MDILSENHRAFLGYLQRRVGSRALAEDILQDAFARNFAKIEALPDDALIPWFYRTLRNAAIDHYRRQSTADKAFEVFAKEIETAEEPNEELHNEICACVTRLTQTLKPEYAEALNAIEVRGCPSSHSPNRRDSRPAMPASGSFERARRFANASLNPVVYARSMGASTVRAERSRLVSNPTSSELFPPTGGYLRRQRQ